MLKNKMFWLQLTYAFQVAVAANQTTGLETITNIVTNTICPIVKFFVGPGAWIVIGVMLIYGVVMLAWGGRNAFRTMGFAAVAALLLAVAKTWVSSQAGNGNSAIINSCLG